MNIIKRDGTLVPFDQGKIEQAILKAMRHGSGIYIPRIAEEIAIECELSARTRKTPYTVKEIESKVFSLLSSKGQLKTAKVYEGYRAVQEFKRNTNTTDLAIDSLIHSTDKDITKENSNKNSTILSTQRDLLAGIISKDIVRRKILPTYLVQAHDECIIHYHDLDYALNPTINCCLINLEDMLDNGTVINDKLVESPKSFETACTVTTQIIAQVSSNQYGGQSITIKHLAPYLRKTYDKEYAYYITKYKNEELAREEASHRRMKALKDGIQTIRYQLSTLQTTNGQAPFASVYLEVEKGHPYEEEMALIVEEMLNQRIEGMKNYKGQEIAESFPKLIYLLDEDNCLEGGKFDYLTKLAARCSALRLVPDYQSKKIMQQNYNGQNFPPMGCRSHLSYFEDKSGKPKFYGRFNCGVVSLNLPQMGLIADGDTGLFWNILDKRLELAKAALLFRHSQLRDTTSDVSPIHWQHGALARLKKGESINSLLENGYSSLSLGYVGLYELTLSLLGVSHTTKEGEEFALSVMNRMKEACAAWKEETGLGFSLYGTPAENLVYRFCKHDKQEFGEVKGITDKLYYTNSYHVNVKEEINAFDKLKFESQFHAISSGGCISYIEVPDMSKNLDAVEQIINFIYHNIQYAEINARPDICYKCDYKGEFKTDKELNWYCPNCGNDDESEMQVLRRTCGYLGTHFWNKGRTQEIDERVLHL